MAQVAEHRKEFVLQYQGFFLSLGSQDVHCSLPKDVKRNSDGCKEK